MKPLASWTKDLIMRVEQLATWATTAHPPKIFWLSGFTYPTAFLTAVLQQSSRTNGVRTISMSGTTALYHKMIWTNHIFITDCH